MLAALQENTAENNKRTSTVLAGFESSGKSALFRGLTGHKTGEERNFKGSTVVCRMDYLVDCNTDLVDIPGIRMNDDSETTRLALDQIGGADVLLIVVRGTHAQKELALLFEQLPLTGKRIALVVTFADKAAPELFEKLKLYQTKLGVPIVAVNARDPLFADRSLVIDAIQHAAPLQKKTISEQIFLAPIIEPSTTWFEHPQVGRFMSLIALILIFAIPVYIAYYLSSWIQPHLELMVIEPLKGLFVNANPFVSTLFIGSYGVLTLGWYSFLWAFPVVLLVGVSVALTEESGLKDRMTNSLDGWLRFIGLSGRDLIPVLSGFGCNVVAVFQSRACSACTRKSCVTLITFGSACSYQIGASLSVFGSAGSPWLFAPYIFILFVVGAIHTRIWNGVLPKETKTAYDNKSFLQIPSWRGVGWRVRSIVKQFLLQAMPIFIGICLAATILQESGLMGYIIEVVKPFLQVFQLPAEAATGIVFSILRKDGLLVLNQDNGAFLQTLGTVKLFLLVYLSSTLSACLVTLWTVRKELGTKFALSVVMRQGLSSVGSALVISGLFYLM